MARSKDFEFLQFAYSRGWATIEKLKLFVQRRGLTEEEFEEITGEEYIAE